MLFQSLSDSTIAHVKDSVFALREFHGYSLGERVYAWLFEWWLRFWHLVSRAFPGSRRSPVVFWIALGLLSLFVIAVGLRGIQSWRRRTRAGAEAERRRAARSWGPEADPWLSAQRLAAEGDYTAGAHALYAAMVDAAAARREVRPHPSKTVGDYARELRRHAPALFPGFRDFARSYEAVIYGVGRCDGERFQRLLALASPVVHPDV